MATTTATMMKATTKVKEPHDKYPVSDLMKNLL